MRILMLHSRYQQRGGEDLCTHAEAELLRNGGHEVDLVEYDNHRVTELGRLRTGIRTVWSREATRDVRTRLSRERFDLIHVQNYFPMISPAVLLVASRLGVPTVQALRNYRLTCVNGILFRDGTDCQRCLGLAIPWHGVRFGCFRDSRMQSAAIATMIGVHRALNTWSSHTDAFVTTSDAVRRVYEAAGFPPDRLYTKADIVYPGKSAQSRKRHAIFVGRLTREKGVGELIDAWHGRFPDATLTIMGTGPHEQELMAQAQGDATIQFTGEQPHAEVIKAMAEARVLIAPSAWEEPFGRIATEAFSVATPVIASARGGLLDIVEGSGGGSTFPSGDRQALASLMRRAFDDEQWWQTASARAQLAFETTYSAGAILKRTEDIYAAAIARRHVSNIGGIASARIDRP